MHELGVVFYIIRNVKKVAEENVVTHVASVTLSIGEVSTIIPDYLIDCWKWAIQKEPLLAGAGEERPPCELRVERIPAITYCEDCHKEYSTIEHGKICPHCGSERTYLKQGNEVEIKELSIEN